MVDGNEKLWAAREFRQAKLGDARRTLRLIEAAAGLAKNVGVAISFCCGAMAAQSISRLFGREEVTLASVMKPHALETAKRCNDHDIVIVAQDTTFLNYDSHKALKGLSRIGTKTPTEGLIMHSAMAVSLDRAPLGLVSCRLVDRPPDEVGKSKDYKKRAFEDKESFKWAQALKDAESAISPERRMVMVGDRENDFYEYFALPRRKNTDIMVRMLHKSRRVISDEFHNLGEQIKNERVIASYDLDVPAKRGEKARVARMNVKLFPVTIKKAFDCRRAGAPESVVLNCVVAEEEEAPEGVTPLNWVLLTSLSLKSFSDAIFAIQVYSTRWVIEEFHRVLKSGVKVERLQMGTLETLEPAIGLYCVIAWRVLYLTKYARSNPDCPASEFATKTELLVVESWMKVKMVRKYRPVSTVADFVLFVAYMGNFPGRKRDGQPGAKVIWQGLRKLDTMVEYHNIYEEMSAKQS